MRYAIYDTGNRDGSGKIIITDWKNLWDTGMEKVGYGKGNYGIGRYGRCGYRAARPLHGYGHGYYGHGTWGIHADVIQRKTENLDHGLHVMAAYPQDNAGNIGNVMTADLPVWVCFAPEPPTIAKLSGFTGQQVVVQWS